MVRQVTFQLSACFWVALSRTKYDRRNTSDSPCYEMAHAPAMSVKYVSTPFDSSGEDVVDPGFIEEQ